MAEPMARIPQDDAREETRPKRGVAIKLFGVALVFLGMLDSMLSWRGGFALPTTYVLLMAAGIFLYAVGAIRGGSRTRHDAGAHTNQPEGRLR